MREITIPVTISKGIHSSARLVKFGINGVPYALLTTEQKVNEDTSSITVTVAEETASYCFLELPGPLFSTGSKRVKVKKPLEFKKAPLV